ncbi:hypothetical protein P43SY_008675 [Pythium insidiosum]|uniref:Serine hydrolase domain-containing protein n=1 Tax=Pythium insidiosum TaxID=114742 RepID=A0AAD5LKA4_PYTIN|nr:hypothetical protein P43SY_008675 [Pythium insidiosum]
MAARARKLRVLCLHGYRTNAQVMENQMKGLVDALGDDAEFIYVNAPQLARGPSEDVIERLHAKDAPFFEWWHVTPLACQDGSDWIWTLERVDEAMAYMDTKMAEIGPVDVVIGFSQGSMLLTILSMRYLQRRPPQMWWKLCICVCGMRVRGVNVRHLFETPDGQAKLVPIPSIHISGKADPFADECDRLADMYDSHPTAFPASPLTKMVLQHAGGHKFPSVKKYAAMYEELARVIVNHCRSIDSSLQVSRL